MLIYWRQYGIPCYFHRQLNFREALKKKSILNYLVDQWKICSTDYYAHLFPLAHRGFSIATAIIITRLFVVLSQWLKQNQDSATIIWFRFSCEFKRQLQNKLSRSNFAATLPNFISSVSKTAIQTGDLHTGFSQHYVFLTPWWPKQSQLGDLDREKWCRQRHPRRWKQKKRQCLLLCCTLDIHSLTLQWHTHNFTAQQWGGKCTWIKDGY